jgi:Helix-turn-helix domain
MARRGRRTAPLWSPTMSGSHPSSGRADRNSAQALALRCRIVLACTGGPTNQEVAAELGVHQATVGKWRGRFVARRLDGLHDVPRRGAPRSPTSTWSG